MVDLHMFKTGHRPEIWSHDMEILALTLVNIPFITFLFIISAPLLQDEENYDFDGLWEAIASLPKATQRSKSCLTCSNTQPMPLFVS